MSEHTPGPWEVEYGGSLGYSITAMQGIRYQFELEADAVMAAAAPEMLEALEGMVSLVNEFAEYDPMLLPTYAKAVAAIAKAKGEEV